jgi:hypothetical protein
MTYAAFFELLRDGTLAPLRRALLKPIAIACLRFFTGCLPCFMWRISVRTSCCAFLPYLRPPERFERLDELLDLRRDDELDLRLEDLRLELDFLLLLDLVAISVGSPLCS